MRTNNCIFKITAFILIQTFLCFDLAWAANGELKSTLAPAIKINGANFANAFQLAQSYKLAEQGVAGEVIAARFNFQQSAWLNRLFLAQDSSGNFFAVFKQEEIPEYLRGEGRLTSININGLVIALISKEQFNALIDSSPRQESDRHTLIAVVGKMLSRIYHDAVSYARRAIFKIFPPANEKQVEDYLKAHHIRHMLGAQAINGLEALAKAISQQISRERPAKVLFINATREGGGVAEMRGDLIRVMCEAGIAAEWEVIKGDYVDGFYDVTKSFHNALQGDRQVWSNSREEIKNSKNIYAQTNRLNAEEMKDEFAKYDVIIIDDPQPAGMIRFIKEWYPGIKVLWRCHIDTSSANPKVWEHIKEQIEGNGVQGADLAIFHSEKFIPPDLTIPAIVMPPAINPLNKKNIPLSEKWVDAIIRDLGIDPNRPIIAEVSRYDQFKDPLGAINSFLKLKQKLNISGQSNIRPQFVFAGPAAVSDDPEGEKVYKQVIEYVRFLNDPDIHILALPYDPITINALQTKADVVLQPSWQEGFALTISEAAIKGTVVIATNVGGMPQQIINGETGYVVDISPEDRVLTQELYHLVLSSEAADIQTIQGLLDRRSMDAEIAEKIYSVINSKTKQRQMGKEASRLIKKKFTTIANARNFGLLIWAMNDPAVASMLRNKKIAYIDDIVKIYERTEGRKISTSPEQQKLEDDAPGRIKAEMVSAIGIVAGAAAIGGLFGAWIGVAAGGIIGTTAGVLFFARYKKYQQNIDKLRQAQPKGKGKKNKQKKLEEKIEITRREFLQEALKYILGAMVVAGAGGWLAQWAYNKIKPSSEDNQLKEKLKSTLTKDTMEILDELTTEIVQVDGYKNAAAVEQMMEKFRQQPMFESLENIEVPAATVLVLNEDKQGPALTLNEVFLDKLFTEARRLADAKPEQAQALLTYLKSILVKESYHFVDIEPLRKSIGLMNYYEANKQQMGQDLVKAIARSVIAIRLDAEARGMIEHYQYLASQGWDRQKLQGLMADVQDPLKNIFNQMDFDLDYVDLAKLPEQIDRLKIAHLSRFYLSENFLKSPGIFTEMFRQAYVWEIEEDRVLLEDRVPQFTKDAFFFIFDEKYISGKAVEEIEKEALPGETRLLPESDLQPDKTVLSAVPFMAGTELSVVLSKIEQLRKSGYIRNKETIEYLRQQLNSPFDEIKELAGRTIIEEVLGSEHKQLRLEALKIILPLIIPKLKTKNLPCAGQIDLHTHTLISDGYSNPAAFILESFERGLRAVSLTDHDLFPDDDEAKQAADIISNIAETEFVFIPGLEIFTFYEGVRVHLLAYLPDYYHNQEKFEQLESVKKIREKFKRLRDSREPKAFELMREMNKRYPELKVTEKAVRKHARGDIIYGSTVTDTLFAAYPDYFREKGITSAKNVWYKWLDADIKAIVDEQSADERPDFEEVMELARESGAKIAIAHPSEIFEYEKKNGKSGIMDKALRDIAERMQSRELPEDSLLGVAYYSLKLQKAEERQQVLDGVQALRLEYPFLDEKHFFLLPETDSHGKFSGPPGMGRNYPEDKNYTADLLEAIFGASYGKDLLSRAIFKTGDIAAADWERLQKIKFKKLFEAVGVKKMALTDLIPPMPSPPYAAEANKALVRKEIPINASGDFYAGGKIFSVLPRAEQYLAVFKGHLRVEGWFREEQLVRAQVVSALTGAVLSSIEVSANGDVRLDGVKIDALPGRRILLYRQSQCENLVNYLVSIRKMNLSPLNYIYSGDGRQQMRIVLAPRGVETEDAFNIYGIYNMDGLAAVLILDKNHRFLEILKVKNNQVVSKSGSPAKHLRIYGNEDYPRLSAYVNQELSKKDRLELPAANNYFVRANKLVFSFLPSAQELRKLGATTPQARRKIKFALRRKYLNIERWEILNQTLLFKVKIGEEAIEIRFEEEGLVIEHAGEKETLSLEGQTRINLFSKSALFAEIMTEIINNLLQDKNIFLNNGAGERKQTITVSEEPLAKKQLAKPALSGKENKTKTVPEVPYRIEDEHIREGNYINHKLYGVGRIEKIDGEGPERMATTRFALLDGTKNLVAGLALNLCDTAEGENFTDLLEADGTTIKKELATILTDAERIIDLVKSEHKSQNYSTVLLIRWIDGKSGLSKQFQGLAARAKSWGLTKMQLIAVSNARSAENGRGGSASAGLQDSQTREVSPKQGNNGIIHRALEDLDKRNHRDYRKDDVPRGFMATEFGWERVARLSDGKMAEEENQRRLIEKIGGLTKYIHNQTGDRDIANKFHEVGLDLIDLRTEKGERLVRQDELEQISRLIINVYRLDPRTAQLSLEGLPNYVKFCRDREEFIHKLADDVAGHEALIQRKVDFLLTEAGIMLRNNYLHPAMMRLREVLSLSPHNAIANNNLGIAYLRSKKYEEAAAYFKKALVSQPDFLEIYISLSSVYTLMGDYQGAYTFLEEGVSRGLAETAYVVQSFRNIGILKAGFECLREGNFSQAIAYFSQILDKKETIEANVMASKYRHIAYDRLEGNLAAREYNLRGHKIDEDLSRAYNYLGEAQMARGNLERAREELVLSLEANPLFGQAEQNLEKVTAELLARSRTLAVEQTVLNSAEMVEEAI